MARKHYVIFLIGLLVSSCAQVGVISGGNEDDSAPKPIAEKVSPPNESTNFQGNSVEIPFNEYFTLVNPIQNIRMIPPHATVNAAVKGKTLSLSWDETLEPNTTYAIYLNNTVKDLTEGNDTIIQYVFSTGDVLDTLSYTVAVTDAKTGEAIDDCVVALYQPMSNKLISFAEPNNGIAELNYLRPGEYRAVAFIDENRDLELQEFERIAFPNGGKILVDSSRFDSIPLRMFSPKPEFKLNTLDFIAPCSFILSATGSMRNPNSEVTTPLYINDEPLQPLSAKWFSDDSLMFYFEDFNVKSVAVSYNADTTRYRFKPKDREKKIVLKVDNNGVIAPSENISFSVNGRIESFDKSKVKVFNSQDSTEIIDFEMNFMFSTVSLKFDRADLKSIFVEFEAGAIVTSCGNSEAAIETCTLNSERDYGTLMVDVSEYNVPLLIELIQRGKVVRTITVKDVSEPIEFAEVIAGEYWFKVIRDLNGNGTWDVGNYAELIQPEPVDFYSKKTKVRANWSIDVTLTPTY